MCCSQYVCICPIGKSILALVAHLIDTNFKLHELLIFAKPFSEVVHSGMEVENTIKTSLASFGIRIYDTSKNRIVDKVSKHAISCILSYIAFNTYCVF